MPANAGDDNVMETRSGDVMETRGRSDHVEKMGNEAMNCLVQVNNWKLALGRGGGGGGSLYKE
jgi:hypothetical protein